MSITTKYESVSSYWQWKDRSTDRWEETEGVKGERIFLYTTVKGNYECVGSGGTRNTVCNHYGADWFRPGLPRLNLWKTEHDKEKGIYIILKCFPQIPSELQRETNDCAVEKQEKYIAWVMKMNTAIKDRWAPHASGCGPKTESFLHRTEPETYNPNLIMRKHQKNPCWGDFFKGTGVCPSKCQCQERSRFRNCSQDESNDN